MCLLSALQIGKAINSAPCSGVSVSRALVWPTLLSHSFPHVLVRSWSGRLKAMSGNSNNHGYEFVSLPCSIRRANLKLVKVFVFLSQPMPQVPWPRRVTSFSLQYRPCRQILNSHAAELCSFQVLSPTLLDRWDQETPSTGGRAAGSSFPSLVEERGAISGFSNSFPSRLSGWKGLSYLQP